MPNNEFKADSFIGESVVNLQRSIGNGKVLLALSGGVDSMVAAVLINKAVGKRLHCVFVDHGLLRKGEADIVESVCNGLFDINLYRVNAADRFLARLSGVTDPEIKRKIIGEEFIRIFEETAHAIGDVDFFAQGTIYTDVIESGVGGGAFVKSHHNVGGLPKNISFKGIIEPLRTLYKNQVREVGHELGLPDVIVRRQAFPGPGLAVRVLGEVTEERLAILREADAIFTEELAAAGLSPDIDQYFAVLTNIKSVGTRDGVRGFNNIIALRAVHSKNKLTATIARIPYETLERVSARITSEVPGVSRVVYDISSKPPATIEWE